MPDSCNSAGQPLEQRDCPLTWKPLPPPNWDYLMTPPLQPLIMERREPLQGRVVCGDSRLSPIPAVVGLSGSSQANVAAASSSSVQPHQSPPTAEKYISTSSNIQNLDFEWSTAVEAPGEILFNNDDLDEFYSTIDFSAYDELDTKDSTQVPSLHTSTSLSGHSELKGHSFPPVVYPLFSTMGAQAHAGECKRHKVSSFVEKMKFGKQESRPRLDTDGRHDCNTSSKVKYFQTAEMCSVCNKNFPPGTPEQDFDHHCKHCYADAILIDSD